MAQTCGNVVEFITKTCKLIVARNEEEEEETLITISTLFLLNVSERHFGQKLRSNRLAVAISHHETSIGETGTRRVERNKARKGREREASALSLRLSAIECLPITISG